jgi:hypothetical protein
MNTALEASKLTREDVLRGVALEHAMGTATVNDSPTEIAQAAQVFYDFLAGGNFPSAEATTRPGEATPQDFVPDATAAFSA